ncbi:hypothetical protein F4810DRAFT_703914 [Camillea tinctor]|nr:hypothetical protein F4810DRAFT_703914 [Camillea tinctor]
MSNGINGFHKEMGVNGTTNGYGNGAASLNGHSSDSERSTSTEGIERRRMPGRKNSSPLMPAFMVSAPGKVIVFGEHAVVHGKAAIAASISLRSYLHVTTLSKSKRTVTLRFPDIELVHTWNIDDLPWDIFSHPSKKKYYYDLVTTLDPELVEAIQPHLANISPHKSPADRKIHQNSAASFLYLFLSLASKKFPGCIYTLRSTIPIGAGLGSSASIAVCLSAALMLQIRTLSGPHPDQPPDEARLQVERINRWAFVGEMCIHGNPSGLDNTISTQGKAVMYQRTEFGQPPAVKPLWDFPELPLLLVDTRSPKSTATEVAKVAKLKDTHQKLVGSILDAIDKVTRTAETLIAEEDFDSKEHESLRRVGELMSINHGLLVSLGVSHPRLERIRELIDYQNLGWTKLTGAGGGGCSITLMKPGVQPSELEQLERRLEKEGYQKFRTTLGGDGIGVLWPAVLKNGLDEDEEGGMEIDLEKFLNAPGNDGVEKLGFCFCKLIMPPKNKGTSKQQSSSSAVHSIPLEKPKTVREQAWQRYWITNPYEKAYADAGGLDSLSPTDRQGYLTSQFIKSLHLHNQLHNPKGTVSSAAESILSKKSLKEFWKQVNEASIPLRTLPEPHEGQWGTDRYGRNIGDYTIEEHESRQEKKARIVRLQFQSRRYRSKRAIAEREAKWAELAGEQAATEEPEEPEQSASDYVRPEKYILTEEDKEAEKERRKEMAALKKELYGERVASYALDPDWDDVTPIPQVEPEGALAAIAYTDDYAESMSYLRAVMAAKEYSPRCLQLTEYIISMNPAHYTALNISVPDEISWLNRVSLLLMDHYYPALVTEPERIAALAASERAFLTKMLKLDTKNYHVWSYRQYLVRKLGMWGADELASVEALITADVRNNSAWSHRFFVVFSDPACATPDSHATERDPKVPADVIDREVAYATDKIKLAPQNQSPWNYLRGVLTKGGRPLGEVRALAEGFVENLGADEGEVVRSSHALDWLADIYQEAGEKDRADLCLRRLGDKWDRVRKGYWEYRRRNLDEKNE